MSELLNAIEITESRPFVKEVEVRPGRATTHYSIPTPEDSPIGGADAAEVALNDGPFDRASTEWAADNLAERFCRRRPRHGPAA